MAGYRPACARTGLKRAADPRDSNLMEHADRNNSDVKLTIEVESAIPATPQILIKTKFITISTTRLMAEAYIRRSLRRTEERNRTNNMQSTYNGIWRQ
jgi:hypothetical protein